MQGYINVIIPPRTGALNTTDILMQFNFMKYIETHIKRESGFHSAYRNDTSHKEK